MGWTPKKTGLVERKINKNRLLFHFESYLHLIFHHFTSQATFKELDLASLGSVSPLVWSSETLQFWSSSGLLSSLERSRFWEHRSWSGVIEVIIGQPKPNLCKSASFFNLPSNSHLDIFPPIMSFFDEISQADFPMELSSWGWARRSKS